MKLEKFTEEHIGKTITIRQWDDMVKEFGLDYDADIPQNDMVDFDKKMWDKIFKERNIK